KRLLCVALLACSIPSAGADSDYKGTGEELARFAATYELSRAQGGFIHGGPERAMDVAYFSGFVNGVAFLTDGTAWCPAGSVYMAQMWSAVSKYLADHPQEWN